MPYTASAMYWVSLVPLSGNIYEGFVLNNGRSGPGTLFRGNVKRVYDPRSGRNLLRSNRVYEGSWRANELRSGSMVRRLEEIARGQVCGHRKQHVLTENKQKM